MSLLPIGCNSSERYVEKLPVNAEKLPVNAEKLPVKAENLPVNAENLPVNAENLPVKLKNILRQILANPKIMYDELAVSCGKRRETVRVYLKCLREQYHLIERVGADKNGYWRVLEPGE